VGCGDLLTALESLATEAAILENQFFSDLSKLQGNPFSRAAGADHPYLSSSFREALASLYYGLENGSRILLLSAGPGLGKTTLLRHLERRLQHRGRTLFVTSNPDEASNRDKASEVLRKLLCEIGGAGLNGDLRAMGIQIDDILPTSAGTENPLILLLDYNENVPGPALEIVYYLANLQSLQKGLLRVVIAGPTGVAEELARSEFAENIRHVPLAPLTTAEVESYIEHRLRLGGWKGGPLFTAKAYAAIAERSSAKPSAINEICFDLLQKLSEPGTGHLPGAGRDATLDESYINFVMPGRQSASGALPDNEAPKVARPAPSLNRRTATLACITVILVIAIAGLWYRIAIKQHSAKHFTTQITSLFAAALHHALFHVAPVAQLSNLPQVINGSGVTGTAIIASPKTEAGSGPAHDVGTANLSHVALGVVSDRSSPASGKATTPKTVAVGLANGMLIVPSSPAITPKNAEIYPTEPVAKRDLNVNIAPLTRTASASPTSRSASIATETTAPNTVDAPRRLVTAGEDPAAARPSAAEMADYEIRRGDSYMNMGDYDKAVVSFSIAIAFAPNDKEAQEKVRRARSAKAAEENVLQ
jgi:MSHA biogenesis protein MshM